jgi:16S rRNA (uracil1498-N3)-methyltransferase
VTTAPVFAHPGPFPAVGGVVRLDGPEGRHAATVRRLRVGEELVLTDGSGTAARGVVETVDHDSLTMVVAQGWTEPPPAPRIVVVQALPKGDRGETAVETLTEVGVDVIVPWQSSRSVTRWRDERGASA